SFRAARKQRIRLRPAVCAGWLRADVCRVGRGREEQIKSPGPGLAQTSGTSRLCSLTGGRERFPATYCLSLKKRLPPVVLLVTTLAYPTNAEKLLTASQFAGDRLVLDCN